MARKNFCLVPAFWSRDELQRHRCSDGSHGHLTLAQRNELLEHGVVEWLLFPRVLKLKRQIGLRGLSCKVGGRLAVGVERRELWALVMLAEVRGEMESRHTPAREPDANAFPPAEENSAGCASTTCAMG